ncbi:hypothetical protein BG015_004239 [Linnemannia schmuckeri]|uniref:Uncharacterized protein n=1 Tax=Linnemannia schmuckeri TaxID=64567 RepID=A0A9P5RDD6_9FUNG|nr:hypothetical protein BG015_004239 [Linnemannia schmuckeri]
MLERVTQPALYRDAVFDISEDPHILKSYNVRIMDVTKALAGKGLVKKEVPTSCPLSTNAHESTPSHIALVGTAVQTSVMYHRYLLFHCGIPNLSTGGQSGRDTISGALIGSFLHFHGISTVRIIASSLSMVEWPSPLGTVRVFIILKCNPMATSVAYSIAHATGASSTCLIGCEACHVGAIL